MSAMAPLVEAILKEKIVRFPRITVKGPKKVYELAHLAAEVESVKETQSTKPYWHITTQRVV